MTNQPLTLEQVQEDFKKWRQNRGKRTLIPEHLWHCAIELTKNYRTTHIANALGINHSALKNRLKAQKIENFNSSESISFLQINQKQPVFSQENSIIEFKRMDGSSMIVQTTSSQIANFIETFLRGSQCCN